MFTFHPIRRAECRPGGFTLVELMVVLVIVAMLASLTLAGLSGARQRAKIDKTRSTIRKLNEIILPQYESYLSRRVPVSRGNRTQVALSRLTNRRMLMVLEMPDQWADVGVGAPLPLPRTAPMIRYSAAKPSSSPNLTRYESAECLALIVMRGGFSPDAAEVFRNDEVGDIDNDGAPEFLDGWGRPIGFIRWPAGFDSPLQPMDPTVNPDPMDPMKLTSDYGLTPLIFSPGPDEVSKDPLSSGDPNYYGGLVSSAMVMRAGWFQGGVSSTTTPPDAGSSADQSFLDNIITNHDLIKK